MPDPWRIERRVGDADALHHLAVPTAASMWMCEPERPALVLGSTQDRAVVDASALVEHGVDLVVRRSGGGAVLLDPTGTTWVDLVIPVGHPLWDPDVGRATHWVGDLWVRALAACGIEATVHRGPMRRTEWSGLVCFAGLGPGEVTTTRGEKLVGVSQRRTRETARFQTVVYHRLTAPGIVDLLSLSTTERTALADALEAGTSTIDLDRTVLVEALTTALAETPTSIAGGT